MNYSRLISIASIVFGGVIAFYAQAEKEQNQYVLIAGIMLLMFGLYRISRNIPSKHAEDSDIENNEDAV